MQKIVVIGANEYQLPLVQKINAMGYESHVFAWANGAIARDYATEFYPVSILDKEQILDIVSKLKPAGICSIGSDIAMLTVNYIADCLGLTSNSLLCTERTTNKLLMRQTLDQIGINNPQYMSLSKGEEIPSSDVIFPVIVKPVDRSGSRGVTKVYDYSHLHDAVSRAIEISYSDTCIIETFIDGVEYSVESISFDGYHNILQITKKETTGAPYFVEKGHIAPAQLSQFMQDNIESVVINALNKLEVSSGASHSEIKVTPDGSIFLIEVGARMGGDFIGSHLVSLASGIDFLSLTIDCCLGKSINKQLASVNKDDYSGFAFVRYVFDDADLKAFYHLREKYPNEICAFHLNDNISTSVMESSERSGYYIVNTKDKAIFSDLLSIAKMSA